MTLAERRIAVGLNQDQVAKLLNIHQTAVSRWETGDNKPRKSYHKQIAKLYKCSIPELEDSIQETASRTAEVISESEVKECK